MANRIEVKKLLDGPRNLCYHVYLQSDGASGDIDSYAIIDPANETMEGSAKFTVDDITYSLNGFAVRIHFEYLIDDTLAWVLTPNNTYVDFKKYGGLADRSDQNDATGRILLSTIGLVDLGDEGSLIIKVRKD